MSIEDDLRGTLRDRATAAMPPADLLDHIRAGVRRDRRRRRLVAGGAAVAVLVTALAVPLLRGGDGDRPPPLPAAPAPPAPSPSASDEWRGPWTPTVSFPLRPGWVPAGLAGGQVFQRGPNVLLQYDEPGALLSAEVGPVEPDGEVETTGRHTVTIDGRPATVYTAGDYDGARPGDRHFRVVRQVDDALWVQVLSFGSRPESEVLRFAGGLGDEPGGVSAGPAPFTFAELPPWLTDLQFLGPTTLCLAARGETGRARNPDGFCLDLLTEPFEPPPDGETLTVGGRTAGLNHETGAMTVDLGGNRVISISWDPEKIPLPRADVLRLAGGITVRR